MSCWLKHCYLCFYFNVHSSRCTLVYEIMPGSPEDNLDEIWSRCLTYYREHKIVDRYRNMKLGLFCKPSTPYSRFPKLRGKAVEVRNLGPPLSKIWGELMNPALPLHLQVAFLLKSSVKLEKTLRDTRHCSATRLLCQQNSSQKPTNTCSCRALLQGHTMKPAAVCLISRRSTTSCGMPLHQHSC